VLRFAEHTRYDDTRTLTLTINGFTFRVTQEAAVCVYTLGATGLDARNEGGRLSFTVSTNSACAWTAVSNEAWITVLSPTGRGSDTVHLEVSPNTGDVRQGLVTIGGQRVTVTQARG